MDNNQDKTTGSKGCPQTTDATIARGRRQQTIKTNNPNTDGGARVTPKQLRQRRARQKKNEKRSQEHLVARSTTIQQNEINDVEKDMRKTAIAEENITNGKQAEQANHDQGDNPSTHVNGTYYMREASPTHSLPLRPEANSFAPQQPSSMPSSPQAIVPNRHNPADDILGYLQSQLLTNLARHKFDVRSDTQLSAPALILFKQEVAPIARLNLLIDSLHDQVSAIMGWIHEPQPLERGRVVYEWKEGMLMALMTEIAPRMAGLNMRIGEEARRGIESNMGGVRLFVGSPEGERVQHDD